MWLGLGLTTSNNFRCPKIPPEDKDYKDLSNDLNLLGWSIITDSEEEGGVQKIG